MTRSLGVFLLMLMLVSNAFAQHEPYANHYMFNLMSVNPGYAGASDGINVTGIVHDQWHGFVEIRGLDSVKVAPNTNYISIDAPINFLHGGVGGSIIQDNLGGLSSIEISLAYAFRTTFLGGDLGIGPQVKLNNRSIDFGDLVWTVEEGIEGGEQTDMIFDLGAGAYWEMSGQYYVGLSVSNILQSSGSKTYFSNRRHYFLNAGYHYIIPSKPEFQIDPSLMLIYDGTAMQYFFGSMVQYKNKFYGGLSYSLDNDLAAHIGFYYKDFMVGYAYGLTTSRILSYSGGSHEIFVNYNFKIEVDKIRNRYKNTRFL